MKEYSYEEFEELFHEYYQRYGDNRWKAVWESMCHGMDIEEDDEIYGRWFDELVETIQDRK